MRTNEHRSRSIFSQGEVMPKKKVIPEEFFIRYLQGEQPKKLIDELKSYNISKKTFYRRLKEYMGNVDAWSPELREQVSSTFLKELSISATASKLSMSYDDVSQILSAQNFNIPDDGSLNTRIIRHVNNQHYASISPQLQKIIDGCLLGDHHICCESPIRDEPFVTPLSDYTHAINTIYDDQTYNRLVDVISKTPTAYFDSHMSFLAAPWLRHIGNDFEACGHSVKFQFSHKSIYMKTNYTVNLFWQWRRWYYPKRLVRKHRIKNLAQDCRITPLSLTHLFVADGTTGKGMIRLCTLSFSLSENKLLASRLQDKNINVKVVKEGTYYHLRINHLMDRIRFFDYLDQTDQPTIKLAKQLFPWKFDTELLRKDVYNPKAKFVDEDYLQQFLKLLKRSKFDASIITAAQKRLFPWIFSS
ncbi:MAG: hypothetical protein ACFFC7_29385 [Candidatus Hermodarchaeota archaeon]